MGQKRYQNPQKNSTREKKQSAATSAVEEDILFGPAPGDVSFAPESITTLMEQASAELEVEADSADAPLQLSFETPVAETSARPPDESSRTKGEVTIGELLDSQQAQRGSADGRSMVQRTLDRILGMFRRSR